MANYWDSAPLATPAPAPPPAQGNYWDSAPLATPAVPAAPTPVYSGSVLPMTRYSDGSVAFDPHAGVVGMIGNALSGVLNTAKTGVDLTKAAATGQLTTDSLPAAAGAAAKAASLVVPLAPGAGLAAPLERAAVMPPAADALHAVSSAGYDGARDLGVDYASPAVAEMARQAQADLNARGRLDVQAPGTHTILDRLQAVPAGDSTVPFGSLHAAYKSFAFGPSNPEEQAAGKIAQSAIRSFLENPPAGAVAPAFAGPAAATSALLTEANKNAAAGFRSDLLNGLERSADLRSSAANSGANIGNTTRGKVASALLSDNKIAGFSPKEVEALEGVVHGSPGANLARSLANRFGGGGGMGHTLAATLGGGVGAALGGETGAMIGAGAASTVGPAFKALQNRMDTAALARADEAVRSRSPLFEQMQAAAPMVGAAPSMASQALDAAARIPLPASLMGAGAAASVNNAAPDSRAAALAKTLTQARPQGGGLGALFATPGTI